MEQLGAHYQLGGNMSIIVRLYEESGPVVAGRGANIIEVDNIGWKSAGTDETSEYVYDPISRPTGSAPFSYSYKKVNFIKIEGTYGIASRVRFKIYGDLLNKTHEEGYAFTDKVRLFYKLTDVYETPTNTFDGTLMYIAPGESKVVYPALSLTSPTSARAYPQYLESNTTYYTQYLVTQLFVEQGTPADFGNLGELNIECYVDEYEDGNI